MRNELWTKGIVVGIIILFFGAGMLPVVRATGPVHNVRTGKDYWAIQAAIDDTSTHNGDTIQVDSGTYSEDVNVNKILTLESVDTGGGYPIVYSSFSNSTMVVSANEVTIKGFNITGSSGNGIQILDNYKVSIINNFITENNLDGILDNMGNQENIIGNIIKNNKQRGINLYGASGCNISNNKIISNGQIGIFIDTGSSNKIFNNTIYNNTIGIEIRNCPANTIEKNNISYNTHYFTQSGIGICLLTSSSNIITKNFISYNDVGFSDSTSSNNNIFYNDFRENDISIELLSSILGNIISNNIVSTTKLKMRAIGSFAIAISNWWGDIRGPWLNIIRLLSLIIVFPWSFKELPIDSFQAYNT